MNKLTLITNITCPFSRRVNVLVREKQLNFEQILVDLRNKTEFHKQCYSKCINKEPGFDAKVPILIDGDNYITDSQILTWYIAQKYVNQGYQILPQSAFQRVKMRLFIQNFTNKLGGFVGGILAWNKKSEIQKQKHVQQLEKFLQSLNQNIVLPYAMGQQFNIADLFLFPNLQRWGAFQHFTGVSIDKKYGKIYQYLKNVQQRKSVKQCIQPMQVYIDGLKHFYN